MAWTFIFACYTFLCVCVAGSLFVDDNAKPQQTEGDDRLDTDRGFLATEAADANKQDHPDEEKKNPLNLAS